MVHTTTVRKMVVNEAGRGNQLDRAVRNKTDRTQARRRATIARNADPFGFKAVGL